MDRDTKLTAIISFLLALTIFVSVVSAEQRQRNEKLQTLSDDEWVKRKIAERFPDFPVITLGDVTNTADMLKKGTMPNQGRIVELVSGGHPEYYRWFIVNQREPDPIQYDPTNHHHLGFITSDLEIYDLGLDTLLQ